MQSKRKGVFAFAMQEEKGTPALAPTFAVPKAGGGIGPVNDRDELPVSAEGAQRWGPYKQRARSAGTPSFLAQPGPLSLLLFQVCGSVSSEGDEHEFLIVDDLPEDQPLTVWDMVGGAWMRFVDVYVPRLTLRGSSGENITVEVELIGGQAGPAEAPDYELIEPHERFKFIDSTFELGAEGPNPEEVNNGESFEVTINRNPAVRYGTKLTPASLTPEREIDASAGLVLSEADGGWDYLHAAHFGGVDGTEMTQDLPRGSFELNCGVHPSDLDASLVIASAGDNWIYGVERPTSDSSGGPVEFDVAGPVGRPTGGGSELVITLVEPAEVSA